MPGIMMKDLQIFLDCIRVCIQMCMYDTHTHYITIYNSTVNPFVYIYIYMCVCVLFRTHTQIIPDRLVFILESHGRTSIASLRRHTPTRGCLAGDCLVMVFLGGR